jgi:hypothetical protein
MHDLQYESGKSMGSLELTASYFKDLDYKFATIDECQSACNADVCKTPYRVWPGVYDEAF